MCGNLRGRCGNVMCTCGNEGGMCGNDVVGVVMVVHLSRD
jgi:hypothetical protein